MADTKQTGPKTAGKDYNPNPNQVTAEQYQQVQAEYKELEQKQLNADSEFMWQHYNRLLRAVDVSLERGMKANLVTQRKSRKEQAQAKREAATPKKDG